VQPVVSPVWFCVSLFVLMVGLMEIGRRVADRRRARGTEDDKSGLTTVEGAVFALFGLMIAFTFSGAASRFNEKRMLIVEEASAIEAAYLRLEMLPADIRDAMRARVREYVDSRIRTYEALPDLATADREMEHTRRLADNIWVSVVAASNRDDAHRDAGKLLLPAVNEMIDMMNTRTMALYIHPPGIVYSLLYGLGLLCALLAGFRMSGTKHRSWVHILTFVAITVSVVYFTIDIEYPRWGLIKVSGADEFLLDLRKHMH
jgi:hypothetical protein